MPDEFIPAQASATLFTVWGHQDLDLSPSPFILVTVTVYEWGEDEAQGSHFTRWTMPKTKKSLDWLESLKDYDTHVEWEDMPHRMEPKGVHNLVVFEGEEMTACNLSYQRYRKYGQSIDQAFQRVLERPTCPTCKSGLKRLDQEAQVNEDVGLVLRQWSWDNVPEDYRPGGPKHRFGGER